MICFRTAPQFNTDAALIFLTEEQLKNHAIADLDWPSLQEETEGLTRSRQFRAQKGEVFPLSSDDQMILLCGLGSEAKINPTAIRIAVRKSLSSSFIKQAKRIEMILLSGHQDDQTIIALIEGVALGGYTWRKYKTVPKGKDTPPAKRDYILIAPAKKVYRDAVKICEGVNLTRDLINENADTANSLFIEKTIKKLARGRKDISLEILGEKELKVKGLNLHLAVNQGSQHPPRLIIARYKGNSRKKSYDLAMVGKGITFDSGGLNLKPSGHMETMRMDMSGAAAVVGTLKNILALKPKKNILFVCGLAENAIGSRSYKPGDVFKSFSGKTVEIGNTDAEGRLVLADALAYVSKRYKPARIVDLATLTGACIAALGMDYTGLISKDEDMAERLLEISRKTDDRAWRLPLYPELKGCMKSQIADIKNMSSIKGAGTITAGYFLSQFVGDTPWAHLDIAGSAFVEKGERMYFGYGATGSGVRLLTEYIRSL
ncbi:MAG: leucyl aminopeptidase family protein [Candidatus Omnitrophota bacterium]